MFILEQEVKLKKTLIEQGQEILRIAEESGVQGNFLFQTTYKRYLVQLTILSELEKAIKEDGLIVTKEYIKGRENVYTSPAVKEYNNTADSANSTIKTLMKIIKEFNVSDQSSTQDPLMKIINGDV